MDGARASEKQITFRCPPELEGLLPRPYPAVEGLPDWFKSMPAKIFSETLGFKHMTVKKCPPFIDAMTYGFLMPLPTDLRVEGGRFSWDWQIPGSPIGEHSRSPIDYHDNSQVVGTPFFKEDRFLIKFNCFWTIELPPGYSLLCTHPFNRADLPFVTLTGLVDADKYSENFINFPGVWIDEDFEGILPKGTPIAQCVPIARESWSLNCEQLSEAAVARLVELRYKLNSAHGVYRHQFRAKKR